MSIKIITTLFVLGFIGYFNAVEGEPYKLPTYSYMPPEGYVPDAKTAKIIAEAIWVSIYGEKEIEAERPFVATLKDGVWTVEGTYNSPAYFGGTAFIKISKKDGRVLQCYHSM